MLTNLLGKVIVNPSMSGYCGMGSLIWVPPYRVFTTFSMKFTSVVSQMLNQIPTFHTSILTSSNPLSVGSDAPGTPNSKMSEVFIASASLSVRRDTSSVSSSKISRSVICNVSNNSFFLRSWQVTPGNFQYPADPPSLTLSDESCVGLCYLCRTRFCLEPPLKK